MVQWRRLLGLLLAGALVLGACTSDDDAGPEPGGGGEQAEAEGPSRHVLLVGLDGLGDAAAADPSADMLALLGAESVRGTLAPPPSADDCDAWWSSLLHEGGAADGTHLLDALAEADPELDLGAFATSPEAADVVVPTSAAVTSQVAAVDVPGLAPWPRSRLEVEQARNEAIRHLAEAEGSSVTLLQADPIRRAAEDPGAAELVGPALDTADDLVDLAVGSADARPSRAGEDWLTVVVGGCPTAGAAPVWIEGAGVDQPGEAGELGAGEVAALVASYLGVDVAGSWGEVPQGILAADEEG